MRYAIQAHLISGSNEVYWDKKHIKNAETRSIEEVRVCLDEREIKDLYAAINNDLPAYCRSVGKDEFGDTVHEIDHYTTYETEITLEMLIESLNENKKKDGKTDGGKRV